MPGTSLSRAVSGAAKLGGGKVFGRRVSARVSSKGGATNPHLQAARRLARKMRKLPDHSVEETQIGLAICQQLKAFLREDMLRAETLKKNL